MPLLVMKLQKLRSILWNKFQANKQWEHFSEKGEEEIIERIEELERSLYLNTNFDIWKLLFGFVDKKISAL